MMYTHTDKGKARLSVLWDKSRLPRPPVPEGGKVNESNETLVVVPMSDDVHGTGDD